MKLIITMTPEGMERLAKGGTPYSWDFNITTAKDGQEPEIAATHYKVGEVEAVLPSHEVCAKRATEYLKQRIKDTRAETYQQCTEYETRINDLLALPAPQTATAEADDDFPF